MEREFTMEKMTLTKIIPYHSTRNFISAQITMEGKLILIESDQQELDYFERPVKKANWTIRIIDEDNIDTIEIKNIAFIPSEVDMFSDGTILLVQPRCEKKGLVIERNARIYNPNGQLISAFTLGDGIEQMQIDETDTIWVGYFDEGIFGNFGWEEPIGSDGVIAFDKSGEKLWGARKFSIIDSYALNVTSSTHVQFYYYDDFKIVTLNEKKKVKSSYRIEGETSIQQFAFDENGLIGLALGNELIRYRKKGRTYAQKDKIQLVDNFGKRIIGPVFLRGKYIYANGKDGIYKKIISPLA